MFNQLIRQFANYGVAHIIEKKETKIIQALILSDLFVDHNNCSNIHIENIVISNTKSVCLNNNGILILPMQKGVFPFERGMNNHIINEITDSTTKLVDSFNQAANATYRNILHNDLSKLEIANYKLDDKDIPRAITIVSGTRNEETVTGWLFNVNPVDVEFINNHYSASSFTYKNSIWHVVFDITDGAEIFLRNDLHLPKNGKFSTKDIKLYGLILSPGCIATDEEFIKALRELFAKIKKMTNSTQNTTIKYEDY